MSYAAIGIGGTGARCVEALVHLCAAGLGKDELHLLLIDADRANGNVDRVRQTISAYNEVRNALRVYQYRLEPGDPFYTKLTYGARSASQVELTWDPASATHGNTLSAFLKDESFREWQDFLRLLYAEEEIDMEWDEGYRGRASISALVLGDTVWRAMGTPPWSDLENFIVHHLGQGDQYTFVFGSAFGATGAGGFPSVATNLARRAEQEKWRNRGEGFHLGGCLLLPYFTFDTTEELRKQVHCDARNFVVNARSALLHYRKHPRLVDPYEAIYLLGALKRDNISRRQADVVAGGSKQKNPAHVIELIAGLSALHFFQNGGIQAERPAWRGASMNMPMQIKWGTLPSPFATADNTAQDGLELARQFGSTLVALAVHMSMFSPTSGGPDFLKHSRKVGWSVGQLDPKQLETAQARRLFSGLDHFGRLYCEWLLSVHNSDSFNLQLLNAGHVKTLLKLTETKTHLSDAISNVFDPHLEVGGKNSLRKSVDWMWNRMCSADLENGNPPEAARYWKLLHDHSESYITQRFPQIVKNDENKK